MSVEMAHRIKTAAMLAGPMIAAVALLVNLGFCSPGVETVGNALKAQAALRAEMTGQVKVLVDMGEKREDINRQTHEKIFGELKDQREKIYGVQEQILRELRGVGSAPTGQRFDRGRPVK